MIRPLLLVELRRQRLLVVRILALTVLVGVVFFAAGKRAPEELLAALIGCSLGVTLIVPMGISRDKLEGTLDFICGLPVEPGDVASSRFIAAALTALPWAIGIGALSSAVPEIRALNPAAVAVLAWLALFQLSALAIALFARFDLENLLGAPAVALILAVVLVPRLVHALIPGVSREDVLAFLQRPDAPAMIAIGLLVACACVTFFSFAVSVRALAGYAPNASIG